MSVRTPPAEPRAQSAAMPSPFPPIADYAFLSNCHTGALVAPDGAVDWLCVPRFDSPSVFGSLLDREAGSFRLGPFGINVPTARAYEPGTNVLRDDLEDAGRLGRRPRRADDGPARRARTTVTPHTRPPADDDADHMLVRTVDLPRRAGRDRARLRARLRLRPRRRPSWTLVDGGRHAADATGAGRDDPAADRHGARHRGRPGPRPARRSGRARRLFCALSWAEEPGRARATSTRPTRRLDATIAVLARLAGPGPHPRPPLARGRSSGRPWRSRA